MGAVVREAVLAAACTTPDPSTPLRVGAQPREDVQAGGRLVAVDVATAGAGLPSVGGPATGEGARP